MSERNSAPYLIGVEVVDESHLLVPGPRGDTQLNAVQLPLENDLRFVTELEAVAGGHLAQYRLLQLLPLHLGLPGEDLGQQGVPLDEARGVGGQVVGLHVVRHNFPHISRGKCRP